MPFFGSTRCPYCYDRGYFFYFGRGIGKGLGPCYHIKCKHCGGRFSDEHDLVTAAKEEQAKVPAIEENF